MPSPESTRGYRKGDLLKVTIDGTTFFRNPRRAEMSEDGVIGFLDEDDIITVTGVTAGEMIQVFTRLGLGWVVQENLGDLYPDDEEE